MEWNQTESVTAAIGCLESTCSWSFFLPKYRSQRNMDADVEAMLEAPFQEKPVRYYIRILLENATEH